MIRAKSEETTIKEIKAYLTTVETLLIECATSIDDSYGEGKAVADRLEEILDILDNEILGKDCPLYCNLSDDEED